MLRPRRTSTGRAARGRSGADVLLRERLRRGRALLDGRVAADELHLQAEAWGERLHGVLRPAHLLGTEEAGTAGQRGDERQRDRLRAVEARPESGPTRSGCPAHWQRRPTWRAPPMRGRKPSSSSSPPCLGAGCCGGSSAEAAIMFRRAFGVNDQISIKGVRLRRGLRASARGADRTDAASRSACSPSGSSTWRATLGGHDADELSVRARGRGQRRDRRGRAPAPRRESQLFVPAGTAWTASGDARAISVLVHEPEPSDGPARRRLRRGREGNGHGRPPVRARRAPCAVGDPVHRPDPARAALPTTSTATTR